MYFIKILGDKFLRAPGAIVFKIGGNVYKVPLTPVAYREINDERQALELAKKDSHFSRFIIPNSYFFWRKTLLMKDFVSISNKEKLITSYFNLAFADSGAWEEKSLEELIPADYFLRFISDNIGNDFSFWKSLLNSLKLKQSSMHGDFYPNNILLNGEKVYFIDWVRYNPTSCRFFDLIDYHIFSGKGTEESWINFWEKEINNLPGNLYGIDLKNKYFFAYALWKVSEEIKTLYLRKNMNKFKIKKYLNFFIVLKDIEKKYVGN